LGGLFGKEKDKNSLEYTKWRCSICAKISQNGDIRRNQKGYREKYCGGCAIGLKNSGNRGKFRAHTYICCYT